MPETTILTDRGYTRLLKDLRKILEEGRLVAEQAANRILLETYWALGKRLDAGGLTEQAGYWDSILVDLSEDLQIDPYTLRRSVDFFRAYPVSAPRGSNLTWSHYRELLQIPEAAGRAWYEKAAEREGWTRDALVRAIERDEFSKA